MNLASVELASNGPRIYINIHSQNILQVYSHTRYY